MSLRKDVNLVDRIIWGKSSCEESSHFCEKNFVLLKGHSLSLGLADELVVVFDNLAKIKLEVRRSILVLKS